MKPSFALNLTEDGVTLLHRTARGWRDLGRAAFDDPDLPASLKALRTKALALSPKGLTTKVVIPESQILYTTIDVAGTDKASRRAQIEAALQGRTPYDVADLVYDWKVEGNTAHVAVVARETLDEAEGFATEHRFNPMSFVAVPGDPDATFAGEPFFGPSSIAPSLLRGKQTLERDDKPISVINHDSSKPVAADTAENQPEPDLSDGDQPPPVPDTPDAPVGDPTPDPMSDPTPSPGSEPIRDPTPDPVQDPDPVPAADPTPDPVQDPDPVPAADPTPDPVQDPDPVPAADPTPDPVQDPDPVPAADPMPDPVQDPEPVPAADPMPEPVQDPDPVPAGDPVSPPVQDPMPGPMSTPMPPTMAQRDPSPRAPASAFPALQPATRTLSLPELDEAPMAVDVPDEDDAAPPRDSNKPEPLGASGGAADEMPPALSAAALMAFASRRSAETPHASRSAGVADVGPRDRSVASAGAAPSRVVPGAASNAPRALAAKPTVDRPAAARPAPKFSYDDPVPPPPRLPGDPPASSGSAMGRAGKGLRNIGAMVAAMPAKSARKPAPHDPAPGVAPKASDAASTVAAMRPNRPTPATRPSQSAVRPDALARGLSARSMARPGKPRFLGLILTGVLLLLLAVVAAWSSYYLTQRDQTDPVAVAAVDEGAAADGVASNVANATDPVGSDILAPEALAPDTAPAAEVASTPAPQTGLQSRAAGAARPVSRPEDRVLLSGMDPPPARTGPAGLADPTASNDALPSPQMPPPPFGTVYTFDADGLIEPTAEGIVTPDGVRLVAGQPPRLPPARPAAIEAIEAAITSASAAPAAQLPPATAPGIAETAAAPSADVAATAPADAALLPAQTYQANPALADARPRVRPPEMTQVPAPPPADAADDATLVTAEDSRVVSLRPRTRPAAVLAAGETARVASQSASLAANAASEATIIQASASLSPQAVMVSRVPAPRPRNLSRAVEAAVAAASRQTASRPAAEPQGRAADEADNEPEVATAAPRIPTRANVAQQATFVNAINLSNTNLIGVYGSQSQRYALIRQSNGRYRKVSVGDKLDGGRVQAITASEVRYQKGGRLYALALPKG